MTFNEDCKKDEIKITKPLLEEYLDKSKGSSIILVSRKKTVKKDSKSFDVEQVLKKRNQIPTSCWP